MNASAVFSNSSQNITLSATVASGSGTVNTGTVTFTVSQGATTIGTPVTSGTVTGGAASATFAIPAGTAAAAYTITAVYNGTTNLSTSSDNTRSLTVSPAATTTTAANASAAFSTSSQNVTLSATVASGSGTVNTGTVTFTVSQGATTVGTPVTSGTVSGGAASATFVLPASTASGPYTIAAVYSGTTNLSTSSDNTHTLTVGSGATTTTASNATAVFSASSQNVTLAANVTSGAGTVNAGTVTFTVTQGATTIGTPVTSGTVSGGAASATFAIPAGTAAATYTITAAYAGAGGFSSSSDNTHTLTVTPAATTTTGVNASAIFSASSQSIALSATVASGSGTVNTGTVTFTVSQGTITIGAPVTSGTVSGGAASATFALPGATAAGPYTITAAYNGTTNLSTSSDSTHILSVSPASTTTAAANASASFSSSSQNVTLSATVTSGSGTVNTGTVTFTVSQGTTTIGTPVTSGTVGGGAASATFVLPASTASGSYTITAAYSGTTNLSTSSDNTHTLTVGTGATTTAATNASAVFSTSSQNVTLSANVTSGAGVVNAGTVTFTVSQGATTIGTPVISGTVSGGAASATFAIPGGTAASGYTITAAYNGAGGFNSSTDNTHALTITPAATNTATVNASAVFSNSSQNVTLSANVTSGSGTVNTGTVTFTVSQGATTIGTPVTSGTVTGGAASATFALPGGTAVAAYTITAIYSGTANLSGSSDNTHTLTVSPATTTTTGASATAVFSANSQNVTLSANVTSGSGTVNTGTVTFTVSQGATTIGTPVTSGTVTGGAASATFALPGGTAVASYTITAKYNGTVNLASSFDSTPTLSVTVAATTTTAANASASFSSSSQNVTLSATVISGSGTVNTGTVTFTVSQGATTIGTPVTSGTVSGGAASATFVLPASTASGSYTITAAYSGTTNLSTSSDSTHTLTVGTGATTTTASNATAVFSTSGQNVTLSANVTSGAGTVNAGTVTFTVSQGATTIGVPVTSGTVAGGAASATFAIPTGTAAATYTITAAYSGGGGFSSSNDNTHTLTITPAATTTTGVNASAVFSASSQNVSLSATVASGSGTVNTGTVTFTVTQGATTIGTPVTSGTVTGGVASATFAIPAGTAAAAYTITAVYNGTTNLSTSSDNTHTLTVAKSATTTLAANASATFSSTSQNVTLSATVTSGSGTVSTGTVTFTVSQGATTIGTPVTSGTVASGAASATFVLPGGTAAATYTITAAYSGTTNLNASSDATHSLIVGASATTTVASNASAVFSGSGQNVTLSATVTSGAGTVGAGTVTFTVSQGATTIGTPVTSGTVSGGAASATFALPGGTSAATYTITAAYNGAGGFSSSTDSTHTLTVTPATTSTVAVNASASFSSSSQNVTLSATVTSGSGAVNTGTVTFTVKQGATVIGTPVTSGTVSSGAASATFVLPGGTAAATYTIVAAFNGTTNLSTSSDSAHTLTVGASSTTTLAANATASFSSSPQNVTLSATVTSTGGTVNVGTVTFTVTQGATTIGTPVTSGTVTGGSASATFALPANSAAGTYTITAVYNAAGGFATSSDNTHTLTVNTTATTTTAANSSVSFSSTSQNVTLSASVTSTGGTVSVGTVTFTILQGATTIGTPVTSGTVSSGSANATYVLPASTAVGTYTINAVYNAAGGFTTSSDHAHTLTITPQPLVIQTTSLPNGQQGVSYSATVLVTGGTSPYTWGVQSGAFPTGVTINTSTGAISGTPTVSGPFTVTIGVSDSGGVNQQNKSQSYSFTIVSSAVVTGTSPSSGRQADTSDDILITGQFTHFVNGTTTVSFGSSDITVNSVTVNSATSVTANISIATTAIIGARNVTVTTGSEVAVGNSVFTVQAGLPTVTLAPNFGVQGTNPTISITGTFTNFTQGTTTASFSGTSDIIAGAVTVNSPTQATVQIQISVTATLGMRAITLSTGTEHAPGSFTVTQGAPVIISVNPNVGGQGSTTSVVVNANFTSWVNGTTVANFGSGIAVGGGAAGTFGPVVVNNTGQFTASLNIASGATLGPRDITVKTGTEQEVAGGAFTVENCTTTAAIVLYNSPIYGGTGVPLNTQVQFEFNAPLKRSTLSSTNVYLTDGTTGLVIPSTFSLDATGRIVTIIPSQLLPVGRSINAYLGYNATATDACGNNLNAYAVFTTTFTPETSGPSVLQTSPQNSDTNVPLNTQVVLQFSVPVDPITLQNGFTVSTGGTAVPGTYAPMYSNDYTRIVFTPGTTLTSSTSYTVSYTTQLTDVVGNPLLNPGSFNFTTGTATDTTSGLVSSTDPQYNEFGIGTNVAPIHYLSKLVDPISVSAVNAYITDGNTGKLIAGTVGVSLDRKHVTITPVLPLQPGTQYYVRLGYGQTYYDLAGNPMQASFFIFTTAGSAITAGPIVTQISPSNGTTGTPVNTEVVAIMSGLIDPNTVGNSAITVTPQGTTTPVSGIVTLGTDQQTLSWVPGVSLLTSKLYNVSVSGFADTQGNAATPFTSNFTTGSSGTPVGAGSLTALSFSPANGSTGVSNTAQVSITFSEIIDPASANNILVQDCSLGCYNLSGNWVVNPANGAQVTFTPTQPYPAGASIRAYTQDRVLDLAGNSDNASVVTTFTVGNTVDATAPTVTSVTPTNGATGIGRNTTVVLTFSKSINPATINSTTIQLFVGDAPISPSVSTSSDNRSVLITTTLPAASNITVVASPKVQDLSGNNLTAFQSQFTTAADFSSAAPTVITQRPASGATNVPANAVITLFTSGSPLNPSTITANSLLVSHNGVLINGTISFTGNNQAIEFTPSQNFNPADIVQIFLTGAIQDVDGNSLTAYTGQFTVAGALTSVGPNPIASSPNPEYGATNIPLNVVPQVAFDQPLLASTINSTNVYLQDNSTSAHVPGTVSLVGANNNVIQFQPSSPLSPSTLYFFYFFSVTNTSGTLLAQGNSYYQYFTTGTASDSTSPTVVAVSPINGTANIGINAPIIVKFSEAIDPISVTGSTVHISGGSQTVMPVSISFDSTFTTATITPQAPLPANTLMTISISGVTNEVGNAVTAKTTTFTTGAGPDFVQATLIFSPPFNSTNIPTNTAVVVQYSKQMNTATIFDNPVTTGTYLYDTVTGAHVPGTLSFSTDLMTATFVPSAPLLVARSYYFYAFNALDLEGNVEANDYTFFTTSFAPSSTVPAVVNTNPENLLTGVATNTVTQVLFNEPIRPESVPQVTLLQGGTPVSVTPSISQGDLLVSLTPNALLLPNTVYTISVSGVQDLAGHTQSGTFTSTFTTGPTIDLVNGTVTTIDPPYNQTGVGTNALIRVHFSKRINPISLQFDAASIRSYDTGRYLPISLTSISTDRLSATYTPGAPLLPYTPYYFTLSTLFDVAGNYISGNSTYFVTGTGPVTSGPTVSSISPPNATSGAPVNTQVIAIMSAPIDVNTVGNNAITVTPNGSITPVAGTTTLAADEVTLTFVPSANLSTSTLYHVSVGGFADVVENPAVTFTSSFTTGSNSTGAGPGALTLVAVSPANGSVGVSNLAQVQITFSEVIDPASANNILVQDCSLGCANLSGTWAVNPSNGAQVTFTPTQPYPAGASIRAYTQDQVLDLAGNTDSASVVTTFTVGTTADTTAPTVTSVTPANGTTSVGPDPMVVLTFSKSVNPATVTATSIAILIGESPISVAPQISSNNRTVMLNVGQLAPSTVYTVVATSQVQDLSGNALQYFQSKFTSAPLLSATAPTVATQRPANGATGVLGNSVITLFTSGSPLDASTVTNNTVHITQAGVIVSGTLAITGNNQAIEFTPTSNFTAGVIVQINLDSTITDVNSVPLTAYSGQFTVAGSLTSVGPNPIASSPNPEYNATNIPLNVVPQVAFDQPLLASTINSTNVYLQDNSTSAHVPGTVSLVGPNNNVIQFQPSSPLSTSTLYFFYFFNVTNTSGAPLAQGSGYYQYFTTGTTSLTTAPTIVAVGPPNGATGVGINAAIIVTFSSAVDPISVTGSTVHITGGSQTVVPSTISFNTTFTVATVTPQAPMPANTSMTIAISGVTDAEGNAVASQTTTFTTGAGPDLTAPNVVLASSQSGDTVATNATFSYEFDRPMDPGTVNNQTFYLWDNSVGSLQGVGTVTLSSDLKTETLVLPPGTLIAGHQVYAYSVGAQDLAGNVQNAFDNAYITVGSTSDSTPPVVLETNPPASLTTGIPLNVSVQVEFSKEIAQNSVAGIQLLQGGSTLVPVTYSFSRLSHVVTLTPNIPLLPSTSYTLSITGVTDTVGNAFSGTQTQIFTTGTAIKLAAPQNVSVTPCCGQTGISHTTTIQIVFDSPMDPLTFDTTTGNAVLELSSTSAVIPTSVSFSPDYKTVTLTVSGSLASATSYTVVVKYGVVSDQAGNLFNNSVSQSFTTQ